MAAKTAQRAKAEIVYGDRSAPRYRRKSKRNQDKHQRADRIEVHRRIEGDSPKKPRGVVAKHRRGPGMHEFMHGDGDQKRDEESYQALEIDFTEYWHVN